MGRVRRTGRKLVRSAAQVVARWSPRTVVGVADTLSQVADGVAPPACFTIEYRDTRFQVSLVEGRPLWHRNLSRWAAGTEIYELVMLECLTRLVRRTQAPRFIDIGAFMGHYALYVGALTRDRVDVYAVESNPRYCTAIERSVRLNGLSKLKLYNVVLSDQTERAGIEEQEVRFEASGRLYAQTTTLDELCRREGIRPVLAKIDVHGTEGKVLGGMRQVLRDSLEFVLLELHPDDFLQRYSGGMGRLDVLRLLERAGFHVFFVAGHRSSGSPERQRAVRTGAVDYRRVDSQSSDLLLFERPGDVFLLCSKVADIEPILGPSGGRE